MKKVRLWLLALALVVCGVLAAGTVVNLVPEVLAENEDDDMEFSESDVAFVIIMSDYYNQPPDSFVSILRGMEKAGEFLGDIPQIERLVFMSEVFKAHPDKAVGWCKKFSRMKAHSKRIIGWAVRNSRIPQEKECLEELKLSKKAMKDVLESRLVDFKKMPLDPVLVNVWWAQYFVSGSDEIVLRVIKLMDTQDSTQKITPAVRKEARFSLVGMGVLQEKVRKLLAEQAKTAKGPLKKAIAEVQAEIKKTLKDLEEADKAEKQGNQKNTGKSRKNEKPANPDRSTV